MTLEEIAAKMVELMYRADAQLCSVPHGQYECYTAHRNDRAVAIVASALIEALKEEK